jgi:ribonuclease BN (tRNA processing enzyme)
MTAMTDRPGDHPARPQQHADTPGESFSLTVLGTATPYPRPSKPCSGYLLRTSHASIWIDAGSGTMAELQRHIRLEELSAIWISHLHPDHCSDILSVYQWLNNAEEPLPPLPVFGPPGWTQHLAAFLPTGHPGMLARLFEGHELDDHHRVVIGDVTLHSRHVCHSVPTFGVRAEHRGRVFVYSGDSGPCDSLIELARDANLFVCESGATKASPGQTAYHCTPEDAGRIASASGTGSLLLTHLAPGLAPDQALKRAAGARGGVVSLAQVGMRLPV